MTPWYDIITCVRVRVCACFPGQQTTKVCLHGRRGAKQQKSLSSQQEHDSRTQQPGQFGEIISHYFYIV